MSDILHERFKLKRGMARPTTLSGRLVAIAAVAVAATSAVVVPLTAVGTASARSVAPLTKSPPSISSVSVTGYGGSAPIASVVIDGANFGNAPTNGVDPGSLSDCYGNPSVYGDDYGKSTLWLLDASHAVGLYGAAQFGANFTRTNGNCGGVRITSYTANQIHFTMKENGENVIEPGDTVCVEVRGVPGCLTVPPST